MSINDFLKEYLKDIKQQEISKATGIDQSKISLIFNNKRKLIAEELFKIAIAFDINLESIKKDIKPTAK